MGNNYEAWMDYESKWIAGYRRKLMRTTTHITIPITLGFLTLFMGAVAFVDRMSTEDAFYGDNALTDVVLPANFAFASGTFDRCNSLASACALACGMASTAGWCARR